MNKAGLNRNQIKYLVIIAMLIDHIAWAFVPTMSVPGQVMHFIGRLTGPTMACFLAEGYLHTRDIKKYIRRLGIFALISWAPFCLFEFQRLPIGYNAERGFWFLPTFGVIYTLFLGLLAIWFWDKGKCPKWCKVLGIIGLCILSLFGDWGVFDVLYPLVLFSYRDQPKKKWFWFSVITLVGNAFVIVLGRGSVVWTCYTWGVFMVPLLMQFCYNGQGGSKKLIHKWFFYIFYPLHLLVLGVLQMVL
ncbi:MAG: conjugal transfer protein TraX [Acetatifactor sp.]|nr:conjugal transfer protein TraX [Acetatifactor sp.]